MSDDTPRVGATVDEDEDDDEKLLRGLPIYSLTSFEQHVHGMAHADMNYQGIHFQFLLWREMKITLSV